MVGTYNEAGWTYDQLATYNGIELNAGLTLVVNGVDVTAELAVRSLGIHVAAHGNSRGTLDAKLNDPVADPVTEQTVAAYAGARRLFDGLVRTVDLDEHNPGAHHFAKFSAQDAGPDLGIPSAAPFGLSDNPNGSTTMGYRRLRKMTRTTEGGAVKTTYTVTYIGDGLWSNMNLPLTSVILGLSAEELTIVDAQVKWPTSDTPEYAFELGEATVKLAQLVEEVTAIAPGSITQTEISDGAISTPKLAANAVTTEKLDAAAVISKLINVGDTVEIDELGIRVTDGLITVTDEFGTVIIDGSNMFKIAATGTVTNPGNANADTVVDTTLTALGALPTTPMLIAMFGDGTPGPTTPLSPNPYTTWQPPGSSYIATSSGGAVTFQAGAILNVATAFIFLNGSSQAVVRFTVRNYSAASPKWMRYYVLKEAAL